MQQNAQNHGSGFEHFVIFEKRMLQNILYSFLTNPYYIAFENNVYILFAAADCLR